MRWIIGVHSSGTDDVMFNRQCLNSQAAGEAFRESLGKVTSVRTEVNSFQGTEPHVDFYDSFIIKDVEEKGNDK